MSTIKVDGIRSNSASSDAITLAADGTCTASVTNNLSNRRININGGMLVWQRNTSVSVSDGSNEDYQSVDRYGFKFGNNAAGACTVSQSTDVPTNLGFPYSYKIDVTTVNDNSSANTQIQFFQRLEAQDIVNSGWKYNDSNSFLTISFYFKSNKSGTNKLPVQVQTQDGTSYFYVSEITQSDTNWNRHTVKIPGNSNLTFDNNNGYGLEVSWYFTVGSSLQGAADTWTTSARHGTSNSTNYFDSTSNDMFITGIQIEATTNGIATDFEHRSYADELRACQRYFLRIPNQNASSGYAFLAQAAAHDTNSCLCNLHFPVFMRTNPSMSTPGSLRLYNGGGITISSLIMNTSTVAGACLQISSSSGIDRYEALSFGQNNDSDASVDFYAEI